MSQNRTERKDRLRASQDFKVNLKAEMQIRKLHNKIDQLMGSQWQRMLEIQQIQLGMIEQLTKNGEALLQRLSEEKSSYRVR